MVITHLKKGEHDLPTPTDSPRPSRSVDACRLTRRNRPVAPGESGSTFEVRW